MSTPQRPRSPGRILPTRDVPSFPPGVLGVWTFNQTLEDAVASNNFSPGTGSVSYTQFDQFQILDNQAVNRYALAFQEDQTHSATNNYTYSNDWTFSFWWYSPALLGFTKHVTTRNLESRVAPILAVGNSSRSGSRTVLSNATFALTEIGYSRTQNAIRVYLSENGTDVSNVYVSDPYVPGLRHVLVTYLRSEGRFRIDIDGKPGILHSAPTGSLQQSGSIRLNDIVPGFLAHKTQQTGAYLFDLVFTTYGATDNEALKAFRYGYEHITYENLFDARFSYFGVAYSQPTTISTTHIFVDGGNIFAARSNGKIVKGARPVWDKEFSYPDTDSIALLTTSETDSEGETGDRFVVWTSDGLKLKGASIRI